MYLSCLTLNRSRLAYSWLTNPYRIHQRLKMACPDDPRLLYRVEAGENTRILVQSIQPPDWDAAFGDFLVLDRPPECKEFEPCLQAGRQLRFRLVANPTARISSWEAEKHNGEVRKRRYALLKGEQQMEWLARQASRHGFRVLDASRTSASWLQGKKTDQKGTADTIQVLAVQFDGLLVVTDPARLAEALAGGIGPAKGLGCGLLSLARA